ncbi:MAG TPA: hypothetical protein VF883_20155 [Thermoanaerobaculia bacterium]|jgi:hypothetical protein
MKRALCLFVVLALPLAAEETKQQPADAAPRTQPAPQAQPDSPLVAAAKRGNRLGRKPAATVITNETLRQSGANAHVTTTSAQRPLVLPPNLPAPRPTPEMQADAAKAARNKVLAEEAAKKQKADAEKAGKEAKAAAAAEDGYDGGEDDADQFAGQAPKPPQD